MTYTITKEVLASERARYLKYEISFQDYYTWLGDGLGITMHMVPVSIERIREALKTDEHLNNIPLGMWDNRHFLVRGLAKHLPWSQADTVCVLKAIAIRAAEDHT